VNVLLATAVDKAALVAAVQIVEVLTVTAAKAAADADLIEAGPIAALVVMIIAANVLTRPHSQLSLVMTTLTTMPATVQAPVAKTKRSRALT